MADTHPGDHGESLKRYWTATPDGRAKWVDKPHPWTSLYNELVRHVNPDLAKRLTETYFVIVFGYHSGSRKGANPVGPG